MKKFLFVIAALFAGYSYFGNQHSASRNDASIAPTQNQNPDKSNVVPDKPNALPDNSNAVIANAFANQISNLQVSGQGVVIKLLPDDNSGSKHQKFIIQLTNGQTLLVAHNIDLAPRVSGLSEGDSIMFNGQYEWNAKGGVLHWTHRDPNGSHPAGWLQYRGQTYQ